MTRGIDDEIFLSELAQDMRDNGVDDEEFIAAVIDDLRVGNPVTRKARTVTKEFE